MSFSAPVQIDGDRLGSMLDHLHEVGARPGGGIVRPVYGDAWREARDLIRSWMDAAGLESRVDAVGNVWGLLHGTEDGAPVAAGSHFDSVPGGGKFDGPLGVLSAIAALDALRRSLGQPKRSLAALALCEEEGSRFAAGFWASRALLGTIAPDEPDRLVDADGVTAAEAMRRVGLEPRRIADARTDLAAFLELHIEQGPVLDRAASSSPELPRPIGVVRAITGLARMNVRLVGQPDHAGTTPMTMRRDALLGLAEAAIAVRDAALEIGHPAVATIGRVEVSPGASNVVPGEVRCTVDARHPDEPTLRGLIQSITARLEGIASAAGLECEIATARYSRPVVCAPELVAEVRRAVVTAGLRPIEIVSGAGHDAQALAARFPTAMLFVPSRGGRSHCPEEYTTPEDCLSGATVLAEALRRLAY